MNCCTQINQILHRTFCKERKIDNISNKDESAFARIADFYLLCRWKKNVLIIYAPLCMREP